MAEHQRRRAEAKRQRREQRRKLWAKRHPGRVKTTSSHPNDHTDYQRLTTRRGRCGGRRIARYIRSVYHHSWVDRLLTEGQRLVDDARGTLG